MEEDEVRAFTKSSRLPRTPPTHQPALPNQPITVNKELEAWPTTLRGTVVHMGVLLEELVLWFNNQRYITTIRREEIMQLDSLQKLAMELCIPEMASTAVQTTPTIGESYANVSGAKQVVKNLTRTSVKGKEHTPKRARDPDADQRKTPPKKSKGHGKLGSQAEVASQQPAKEAFLSYWRSNLLPARHRWMQFMLPGLESTIVNQLCDLPIRAASR